MLFILNAIMLSVIMLSIIMLSVVTLNIDMLSVIMLIVIMLNVIYADCHYAECHYAECRGTFNAIVFSCNLFIFRVKLRRSWSHFRNQVFYKKKLYVAQNERCKAFSS
jgi:hypothetical protein